MQHGVPRVERGSSLAYSELMTYYVIDAFADRLFAGNPAAVCLLEHPLALHRQLAAARTACGKAALQVQIAALNRAIDPLAFRLCDLNSAEARLVLAP